MLHQQVRERLVSFQSRCSIPNFIHLQYSFKDDFAFLQEVSGGIHEKLLWPGDVESVVSWLRERWKQILFDKQEIEKRLLGTC